MKKQTVLQALFFAVLSISVLFIIFAGTESLFHSDDATAVLVAREQIQQKKLIIQEWNNGTVLWTIGLQTFVLPFLLFIKDWVLCRQLAVILQTVLFLLVVYHIMKFLKIREKLFFLALCILPLSEEILEHTLFQATYLTSQLFYYMILVSLVCFYEKLEDKKKGWLSGILCTLAVIIGCHSNLASVSVTTVPVLTAVVLYYVIENFVLFQDTKPSRKVMSVCAVAIGATVIALVIYLLLCQRMKFDFASAGVNEFIGKSGYGLKIAEYVDEYLLLYGGVGANSLFCAEGVLRILRIVYLFLLCFLSPVYLIWNYKKLESKQRLFLLYSVAVYAILTLVAITTGKCSSRYFIPVYFNNLLLFGIFCNQMEKTFMTLTKMLQTGVAMMAVGCCLFYGAYEYEENPNDIGMWRSGYDVADKELTAFLEENEIHFIYAPYWNAYSNMVISNGRVQAMAYDGNEPMNTKKWLNSNRWNQPKYYNGRTAVLFLPTVKLDSAYWEQASEYLQFGKWNILVFEKNLLLYDDLAKLQKKEALPANHITVSGEELKITGNAEKKEGAVYLYKEGIQKWNSAMLEAGEYKVTIQGNNLNRLSVFCYYLDDEGRIITIDMNKVSKENDDVTYHIVLKEERKVEFFEKNEFDEIMRLDSLQVERTEAE